MRTLAILFAAGLSCGQALADGTPRLQARVVVEGPVVTLGDLLQGISEGADTPAFRAPAPGTTGHVSAARVVSAAAAHGIEATGAEIGRVAVTRASRVVEPAEIAATVAEAIDDGTAADGELEIRLDEAVGPIHVEASLTGALTARSCGVDPGSRRFACVIELDGSETLAGGRRVGGQALRMVELPVLQKQIRRGETIAPTDVAMVRMPVSEAPADALRELGDIVGMAARTTLRPGIAVPADRLMEPVLVGRNDAVTMVYRAGGLMLTVRGRALGAGGRGDVVTVMNTHSNRTVEAVVAGPGQVVVEPAPGFATTALASK